MNLGGAASTSARVALSLVCQSTWDRRAAECVYLSHAFSSPLRLPRQSTNLA